MFNAIDRTISWHGGVGGSHDRSADWSAACFVSDAPNDREVTCLSYERVDRPRIGWIGAGLEPENVPVSDGFGGVR
jgi:hypothetical protein